MNGALKRILGPIYAPLLRARHSSIVRKIESIRKLPGQNRHYKRNLPYFSVAVSGKMGMGAVLIHTIKLLKYADDNNLVPSIRFDNPLYGSAEGGDWLPRYFTLKSSPAGTDASMLTPISFENEEGLFWRKIPARMSLEEAGRIFNKYIGINDVIMDRAIEVQEKAHCDLFDLSIHYRGTDKFLEAKPADFSDVENRVQNLMSGQAAIEHVFLATDCPPFDTYIRGRFPFLNFHSFNLGKVSDASQARHFSDMPGEDKAIEAITNIVLLSRAKVCIRSSSYLSACSKILNPAMLSFTLNKTLNGSTSFPEKEILEEESTRGAV